MITQIAGYFLFKLYGRQFEKAMQFVAENWIPKLERSSEDGVGSVKNRLNNFI